MVRMIAALACALAVAGSATAQELRTVRVTQAVASFAFLPIDYARAAGYFAEEGLDVQQIATRGGGPDLTALVSGDVEFNAAAGTYQIGAILAGREILNVYNFYKRNLIGLVISREAAERSGMAPDAPLEQRIAALRGLRLGMTRPGSLTDKQIRHLLRIGGIPESEVEIVAIGGPPNLLRALESGQIDGFAISVPHYQVAAQRGAVIWVDNTRGDDPSVDPFMMESLLTTPAFAEAHPDVVRGMVRALKRAVADLVRLPAEEIREVVREAFSKVDPEVMLLGIEAIKPALNEDGRVTLEMAENTVRLDGRDVDPQALYATFTDAYFPKP